MQLRPRGCVESALAVVLFIGSALDIFQVMEIGRYLHDYNQATESFEFQDLWVESILLAKTFQVVVIPLFRI